MTKYIKCIQYGLKTLNENLKMLVTSFSSFVKLTKVTTI